MEFNEIIVKEIADSLGITSKQVIAVLTLLNDGATVPFIARYRKEATGALDEEQIRQINQVFEYRVQLEKRKEDIIRLIDEKGMLTDDLKEKINNCNKLIELEDLYRPYKEKKKTKATEAINLGLEPLAKKIMAFPVKGNIDDLAMPYINENVQSTDFAITNAKYIIAEWISDNASYRKYIRQEMFRQGMIATKIKKNAVDEKEVYKMYYDYIEPVKSIRSHRVLAINRAEKEKVINVSIDLDIDIISNYLENKIIKNNDSFVLDIVKDAILDSIKRLIYPSIEREIRAELTQNAEEKAIDIFSLNLKNLLLQPPLKGKIILGVDPAFRTGCKLALIDVVGKVIEKQVIYPHEKRKGDIADPKLVLRAKEIVIRLFKKYKVEICAIGNGTASRETEAFFADLIKEYNLSEHQNIKYIIVSEAGASVYSASDLAREEFPDYEVEERSAVSIARRLQDPLSELVKIDPKSIGVGQYQHDITQSKLSSSLDDVVIDAVNKVGVNINTASKSLLQYVSGLNKSVAENIIKYREENGKFKNREEIKKVPKFGAKTYEQAIGFLRVPEGTEPLDMTQIHPESYNIAEKIIRLYNIDKTKFGTKEMIDLVNNINKEELIEKLNCDEYTLNDILDAFIAPLRDPRDELEKPVLRSDVLHLEDLKVGMELNGTVRNVVDFGCFIDCGLHEDGLLHISKMSKGYIKHPSDLYNVGDLVKVYVESVDLKREKVALTMFPNGK